jgi:putative membrane protein
VYGLLTSGENASEVGVLREGRYSENLQTTKGLKRVALNGGIMFLIVRLIINMVAILIIAYLFPGLIGVDSFWAALVSAFILGIINAIVKPILVFFTFPITILTLGLFLLVINGLMLWLVSFLVKGFHVYGFWGAVIGAILISIVSWILSRFLPK